MKKIYPIITFALIAVFFAKSVQIDSDTYWMMSMGRQIWQNQKIITGDYISDNYLIGRSSNQFITTEWISQLTYYFIYTNLGQNGLMVLLVALGLLTLFFFYKAVSLFTQNPWLKYAFLSLAAYVISTRLFYRPDIFGFFLLAALNYYLITYYFKNKFSPFYYLLPLIFLLWPNIHASSSIGFYLFGSFGVLFILEKILLGKERRCLSRFLVLWVISLFFSALQYRKVFAFLDVADYNRLNIGEVRGLWEFFREAINLGTFAHVFYSDFIYLVFLAIWIILVTFLLVRIKKRLFILPVILLYSVLVALPWQHIRLIPFSLMLTFPAAVVLAKTGINFTKNYTFVFMLIYVFFMFLISASIFTGNIIGYNRGYKIWFEKDQSNLKAVSVQTKFWTGEFPENAPEIINKYLSSKRVVTSMIWGNYLIWHLPDIKVTSDAMIESLTPGEIEDNLNLLHGVGNWEELIEKLQIDTVVKGQELTPFSNKTPAYQLSNWRLVFVNETFALYARADIIKSLPVNLSRIHPELATARKFFLPQQEEAIKQLGNLLAFDPQNGFAREQLALNLLENKRYEAAEKLARESRILLPENPYFSLYLAAVFAYKNQCDQAGNYVSETENKAGGNLEVIQKLATVKKLCR